METIIETFNPEQAKAAQKALCQEKVFPHFAPHDGRCFNCHKGIYEQIDHGTYQTGFSVEKAGTHLITGCPHCHYSYCD